MTRPIEDSVVIITGASSGVGRATARAFAARGAALILAARRPLQLSAAAAECHELGAKALAVPVDTTDEHSVFSLAHKAVDIFGHLDVWFNNAGVGVVGKLDEIPGESLHRAIEINLMGCIFGARACLPHFRKQGYGVLINNACLLTEGLPELMSVYITAKWGVCGLGVALRREFEGTDIEVCTILSGPVASSFVSHAANFTDRQYEAPEPDVSVDAIAQAVVECAYRPRPEVVVRTSGGTAILTDHHHEPNSGILFEPAPDSLGPPTR